MPTVIRNLVLRICDFSTGVGTASTKWPYVLWISSCFFQSAVAQHHPFCSCNTARPLLCWCNSPRVGKCSTVQHYRQGTLVNPTAWSCGRLSKGSSPSVCLGQLAWQFTKNFGVSNSYLSLWSLSATIKFLDVDFSKVRLLAVAARELEGKKVSFYDCSFVFVETCGQKQILIYKWAICWKVGTKDINRVHLG